jgi:hypothetical protein
MSPEAEPEQENQRSYNNRFDPEARPLEKPQTQSERQDGQPPVDDVRDEDLVDEDTLLRMTAELRGRVNDDLVVGVLPDETWDEIVEDTLDKHMPEKDDEAKSEQDPT